MERLTDRFDDGTVGVIDTLDNESLLTISCYVQDDIANASICYAIDKLAEYEDTGLTPEEIQIDIRIFKELWEEKIKEVTKQRDFWECEAKKYCSQLGEIRIKFGLERCSKCPDEDSNKCMECSK